MSEAAAFPPLACGCGAAGTSPPAGRHAWATFAAYGDHSALAWRRTREDALAADPVWYEMGPPQAGERLWLRVLHPFGVVDAAPFRAVWESPAASSNGYGPDAFEGRIADLRVATCRLVSLEISGDGRQHRGAACVEILAVQDLHDIAARPVSAVLDDADARKLFEVGWGWHVARADQGELVRIDATERESDGGWWAVVQRRAERDVLLLHGVWGYHEDFAFAGPAALPQGLLDALDSREG